LWVDDAELNPIEIGEGSAPVAAGEIAVDRGLASEHDLAVGDAVTILTLAGPFEATVTGVTRFGESDAQDSGGTVSIPAASAFDWLNSGHAEYAAVYVRGGVDQASIVAAVEPLVTAGFEVVTGDEFRDDRRGEVAGVGRVLKRALQFFALLALLVGGFVIYNTFTVIVAQRTRELAVLAAIGATPKQLKRSLRFEALVIGLLGSVLGVIAGFALAFGLLLVIERLTGPLPGSGLSPSPGTAIAAIVFGVVITRLSVTLPARRAGRAEPIEALRQADAATVSVGRGRTVAALLGIIVGTVAMLIGGSAIVIGAGTLVLFVGVVMAGPLIAVVGSRLLRPLMRVFGLEGELAVDNTARNPQRTATTSNALLIGVFLVTFVTVAGTSFKDFAVAQINELSTADFTIESNGGTIDDGLVEQLSQVDGVEIVTPFRRETVGIAVDGVDLGSTNLSSGVIDDLVQAAGIDLEVGTYDDLAPGTVVLPRSQAPDAQVGSIATFTDSRGESVDLEVVGIVGVSIDAILTGAITEPTTFEAFVGERAPTVAFIATRPGAQTDTGDEIERITSLRPDVTVQAGNLVGRLVGSIFDFMIGAVNGLLLMSVVIALIGIVNTMTLSIIERRRELGLLRVLGMVDRRVRRMVRIEAVVIAALGTVSGMLLGVFAGMSVIFAVDRLSDAGVDVSLPPGRLALVLSLGVVLGFAAAWLPARRSTRLDELEAIQAT
jgi:putative ABC transport system permease protein